MALWDYGTATLRDTPEDTASLCSENFQIMSPSSSTLFSKIIASDEGLDAVFKTSAGPSTVRNPEQASRKREEAPSKSTDPELHKRVKLTGAERRIALRNGDGRFGASLPSAKTDDKIKMTKAFARLKNSTRQASDLDGTQSEVSDGGTLPTHVVLSGEAKSKASKKAATRKKYIPPNEKPEEVDARTIFVGNLPMEVMKQQAALKALIRHLIQTVGSETRLKVESTRFRSIAFSKSTKAIKDGEAHDPELTLEIPGSDEDTPGKTYYSTAQKKRLAYLRRETNEKADVVNCYVVIAYSRPPKDGDKETTLHPAEAARLLVERSDGTSFMGRTIRVDRVGAAKAALEMAKGGEKKQDMKRTIFVGSLDFEAKEQDLRDFLERLLREERGDPLGSSSINDGPRMADPGRKWVESVRIVRDPDSQLGKGIAYVQFSDVQCVDEILALPIEKLNFSKRKLRVQRCKTISRVDRTVASESSSSTKPTRSKPSINGDNMNGAFRSILKGDSTLGDRLAGLSKSERKEAKAADPNRIARRLAKKNRTVMVEGTASSRPRGIILGKPSKPAGQKSSRPQTFRRK